MFHFMIVYPFFFSVKIGVDCFKEGRHVDAMNEYNKALEIDAQNVEALVARGALWVSGFVTGGQWIKFSRANCTDMYKPSLVGGVVFCFFF